MFVFPPRHIFAANEIQMLETNMAADRMKINALCFSSIMDFYFDVFSFVASVAPPGMKPVVALTASSRLVSLSRLFV